VTDGGRVNRRRFAVGALLAAVYAICLVNAGLAVDATRRLDGPTPEDIDRRYGALRPLMDGVASAYYVTDDGRRFLRARYATAPTVLDPGFVEPGPDGRSIASIDVDGLIQASTHQQVVVLGDFGRAAARRGFVADLAGRAAERGIGVRVLHRSGGVVLLRVGD
jgi:hypothetical protein